MAISWWVARLGNTVDYLGVVFFGLGLVVFVIDPLPNSNYLRLTEEGFTVCSLFRYRTVQRSDTRESASLTWREENGRVEFAHGC